MEVNVYGQYLVLMLVTLTVLSQWNFIKPTYGGQRMLQFIVANFITFERFHRDSFMTVLE